VNYYKKITTITTTSNNTTTFIPVHTILVYVGRGDIISILGLQTVNSHIYNTIYTAIYNVSKMTICSKTIL
jgi:hypothetical protein